MEIEITLVDIICRAVAGISVILCIVLCCYDQHKTAKWLKEKDDTKQ